MTQAWAFLAALHFVLEFNLLTARLWHQYFVNHGSFFVQLLLKRCELKIQFLFVQVPLTESARSLTNRWSFYEPQT